MALGGVDTGSMKSNEVECATPTATGTGLNSAERAVPMASGPVMLFAPVCEISSDSSSDITQRVGAMRESTQKRSDFLLRLKQILGCTHKQTLYMYGVARTKGLIEVDNKQVSKAP